MSKSSVVVESASQDSYTFVAVTDTAPKVMGAPTPHELEPMHDESWLKWWMSVNISPTATHAALRLYYCQKREVLKHVNYERFRDDDDNTMMTTTQQVSYTTSMIDHYSTNTRFWRKFVPKDRRRLFDQHENVLAVFEAPNAAHEFSREN